ncbi:hypothetical protein AC76_0134 [Escherichia coli 5-172-05_S4_C1]|nr:hypothetical protein AD04_0131 [Escherichia coli 5-172-05_S4_C2]KEL41520.1 hypothetical protein AC76_0134 [Escherichia coli 5-172-05_S4_C1]
MSLFAFSGCCPSAEIMTNFLRSFLLGAYSLISLPFKQGKMSSFG